MSPVRLPGGREEHAGAPYVVVYDGECRFCIRTVNLLRDRDRYGRFELVAYQADGVAERFPEIPRDAFEESVQLIGPQGERWEGAAAVERILELVPRLRRLSWLFRIPLARPLARLVYRLVSRSRHRLGCGDHCPVVDPGG